MREARTVAGDAAALAFEMGDIRLGVTLLERGRSMIFTQLGRFRRALDDVEEANPELAQRFSELSATLNNLVLHSKNSNTLQIPKWSTFEDLGVV